MSITRLVAIADTHGTHARLDLPPGDVLIHAGDFTRQGELDELRDFAEWFGRQPHRHKLVIAGNHEWCLDDERRTDAESILNRHAHYLRDQAISLEGVVIYGSPWSPKFMDWAFNRSRGEPLRRTWNQIPDETEVLVTHGPPFQIGDFSKSGDEHAGDRELRNAIQRVRPTLHICGHIHEGYGIRELNETLCLNASITGHDYRFKNDPIVVKRGDL